MAKRSTPKAPSVETAKAKTKVTSKATGKPKSPGIHQRKAKAKPAGVQKENNLPDLRVVYSNSKYILLPLGMATDFKSKKAVVIFTDITSGQVHTIALSVWNRWKLKEVKKVSTEV